MIFKKGDVVEVTYTGFGEDLEDENFPLHLRVEYVVKQDTYRSGGMDWVVVEGSTNPWLNERFKLISRRGGFTV